MKKPVKPTKINNPPSKREINYFYILRNKQNNILFLPDDSINEKDKLDEFVKELAPEIQNKLTKYKDTIDLTDQLEELGYNYYHDSEVDNFCCQAAVNRFDSFSFYFNDDSDILGLRVYRDLPEEEYNKLLQDYENRDLIYIEQMKLYNQEMEKYLEFKKQEKISALKKELESIQ